MKKKIVGVLLVVVAVLCGCGSTKQANVYEQLNDDQKEYLIQEMGLTKEGIEMMDYESVNWNLLGTGMELYNVSSGIEKNGLEISYQGDIEDIVSMNTEMITYEKALAIRQKEAEMCLEDFLDYEFVLTKVRESTYRMELPVQNYPDTYVRFTLEELDEDKFQMSAPYLYHKSGEEEGEAFSFYYMTPMMDAFFENPKQLGYEEKLFYGIQYSSVTDHSLVLEIYNYTDQSYKQNNSYRLYKLEGDKKEVVCKGKGEKNGEIKAYGFSIEPIDFGKTKLEPGEYLVEYGKDAKGYIYTEQTFFVE